MERASIVPTAALYTWDGDRAFGLTWERKGAADCWVGNACFLGFDGIGHFCCGFCCGVLLCVRVCVCVSGREGERER